MGIGNSDQEMVQLNLDGKVQMNSSNSDRHKELSGGQEVRIGAF